MMKKFLAIVLALAVVMCPMLGAVPAFADTTGYSLAYNAGEGTVDVTIDADGFVATLVKVAFADGLEFDTTTEDLEVSSTDFKADFNYVDSVLTLIVSTKDNTEDGLKGATEAITVAIPVTGTGSASLTKVQSASAGWNGVSFEGTEEFITMPGTDAEGNVDPQSEYAQENASATTEEPHEHAYVYTPNNDGTHNGACECGKDAIVNEACDTLGENGVCSKCGYKAAPVHEHNYVDGYCEECGDYKYDVTWDNFSYNIATSSLKVAYCTTATSPLYLEVAKPYSSYGRKVSIALEIGGKEYPFAYSLGTGFTPYTLSGFTFEDMSSEIKLSALIEYTLEGVTHKVYTKPQIFTLDSLLETTGSGATYDAYLAYKANKESDATNEKISIASDDSDLVLSANYLAKDNTLAVTFRAGAAGTYTRNLLTTYPKAGGRTVGLVLSVDGSEFVFDEQALGTGDITFTLSGFTFTDFNANCEVFMRVFHDGTSQTATGHSDSQNKLSFKISDAFGNGTSDLAQSLDALMKTF